MFLPFLLSASLWLPLGGIYTQMSQLPPVFNSNPRLNPTSFRL